MKTIELIAPVNADRTVTIPLPEGVAPGAAEVHLVVVVEDAAKPSPRRNPLQSPGHDLRLIDPSFTFRREDLYGDDGR
jgi:hypothetical protein